MNQFRFGSKAATLRNLNARLSVGRLCPQFIVKRPLWAADCEGVIRRVLVALGHDRFAVRSSAHGEDGEDNSYAGAFTSLLDIAPAPASLKTAINEVFASYAVSEDQDEVLIQPMVRDVVISGVVLTRDLDTGSPYYVINYDSGSGRTDTVTSGGDSKTVLVHRTRPDMLKSPRLRRLIDCVIEIETVTGSHELDIEFCINARDEVYILQVRLLAARSNWSRVPDARIDDSIDRIRARIIALSAPDSSLGGNRTVLSEMTDWNPAEMIGNAPKPLALSLYKALITDRIWAEARAQMGYRMVAGPLLYDFQGRPFIDVRKSFNSFLPHGIAPAHADIIVSHQLEVLAANRDLHDKVEFAIAITCEDFETGKIKERLGEAGLDADAQTAVHAQIHALTAAIVGAGRNGLDPLITQADTLLKTPPPPAGENPLASVHTLLELCRKNGTMPFSQLARHGFIAVQFLRSLAARGAFDANHVDQFMHGVQTVATDLIRDMNDVHAGKKSIESFMSRYGHLRPGTYDIMSWRYEERPDVYLAQGQVREIAGHDLFVPSPEQRCDIQALIDEAGFAIDVDGLLNYIVTAIKGREQSKFAFTRAISNTLEIITAWGEGNGLSRDDLSYLPIEMLRGSPDIGALRDQVASGREDYLLTRALRLPHVIADAFDIDVVRLPLGQPTFVTGKSITAQGQLLTSMEGSEIDDKIALIESADPGFDWIFSHRVLGLITKYGGANSHMAIRCAEFGLPAAIGCGERLFDTLCKAQTIELNASARRLSCH